MPKFLAMPIGNAVDEMLGFCHKALELLSQWKQNDVENPFI